MANPILKVTDGDTSVDLISNLESGMMLSDWTPSIAPLKGGGVYQQSVMGAGKQLVMANYDNATETFSLKDSGGNQDAAIRFSQELFRLLEKARAYWFTPFQTEPVWLVARAPNETNTRYAIIHNYQQSGLDNPYAQPFFDCSNVLIDDLTLVVERGHWANVAPTQSECVELSGGSSGVKSGVVETVAAGADDVSANLSTGHTATSVATGGIHLSAGNSAGTRKGFAVRFSAVDVPDEAIITAVYLRFTCSLYGILSGGNGVLQITAEDADNAAQIPDVAGWNARTRTTAHRDWSPPTPHSIGDVHETVDLEIVFGEVRDRGGWIDGNAMQFFVEEENCDTDYAWRYAAVEHTEYDQADLVVEYTYDYGQNLATCDEQVWAVDKFATANLTHIYAWYNAAWTANRISAAGELITADPPVVGNKVYFGIDTTAVDSGPFNNIILNLVKDQDDVTWIWEYWQGAPTSAWTAFSASNIVDKSRGLSLAGLHSVTFVPPKDSTNGDWVSGDLNTIVPDGVPPSVTAWWVRARVSAIGAGPNVQRLNALGPASDQPYTYTVTWPSVSIASDQIKGDIPAIARITLDDSGQNNQIPMVQHRAILALSSDRGPYGTFSSYDFSAYLPFSDEQRPSVLSSITGVSGDFSYVNDITAPSGRCVLLAPSGVGTDDFSLVVNSLHYFGSYRVFVRARQLGGAENHFKVKVTTEHNAVVFAETNEVPVLLQSTTTDPRWQLLDLGQIDIPTGLPARTADEGERLEIHIYVETVNATGDLYLMDLILMPVDEWIADLQDFGVQGFSSGRRLHIDSISVPKVDVRGLAKTTSINWAEPRPWKTIATQMRLPANTGFKLWLLTARWQTIGTEDAWVSDGITTAKIQLYSAEQYLGLRGNR